MMEFEENRHFTRMQAHCRMTFKRADAGAIHEGLCLNISGSGILFQSDRPVEPGKAMEIHTQPANKITPPLTAYIEVTRCTRTDGGFYLIAGAIKGIKS